MSTNKKEILDKLNKKIKLTQKMLGIMQQYPEFFSAVNNQPFPPSISQAFTLHEKQFLESIKDVLKPGLTIDDVLRQPEIIVLLESIDKSIFLKTIILKFQAINSNNINDRDALLKHTSFYYGLRSSYLNGRYGKVENKVTRQLEMECKSLKAAYIAAFNKAQKNVGPADKPWLYRNELAMLLEISLTTQTRELDGRIQEFTSALEKMSNKAIPADTFIQLQVLDTLFVDQDLRGIYTAYYNTQVTTGNMRNESVASGISELSDYIKYEMPERITSLQNLDQNSLEEKLTQVQLQIEKVKYLLSNSMTPMQVKDIYNQRFELALNYQLCHHIEMLITAKVSHRTVVQLDNDLQQKLQSRIAKYSKLSEQKLLVKMEKYHDIANPNQRLSEYTVSSNDPKIQEKIIFARMLEKAITQILVDRSNSSAETNPTPNGRSPRVSF